MSSSPAVSISIYLTICRLTTIGANCGVCEFVSRANHATHGDTLLSASFTHIKQSYVMMYERGEKAPPRMEWFPLGGYWR